PELQPVTAPGARPRVPAPPLVRGAGPLSAARPMRPPFGGHPGSPVLVVDQQGGRPLIRDQQYVEVSVVIHVTKGRAAADVRGCEPGACLTGHVLELAFPQVQ